MWFGYRLVNWPRFADFLIAVEAEMSKVSWPTKTELYRASMVVIFTMFFLAILLFCYDAFWQLLFDVLKVS
jgi:preprotein translocase subunit SecE